MGIIGATESVMTFTLSPVPLFFGIVVAGVLTLCENSESKSDDSKEKRLDSSE